MSHTYFEIYLASGNRALRHIYKLFNYFASSSEGAAACSAVGDFSAEVGTAGASFVAGAGSGPTAGAEGGSFA